MQKAIHIVAAIVFASCLINKVASYCYIEPTCLPPMDEDGYWYPESKPCDVCKCFVEKNYVRICKEAKPKLSLKKSSITAEIIPDPELVSDEVEITKEEADAFKCPPAPGHTLNYITMTLEEVPHQEVYYYYIVSYSSCCNTEMYYSSVPPECEVVKTGCTSEFFLKGTSQPCPMDAGVATMVG
uniref:uncharacterized protein LOC120345780 n=1 Tax=Styela clava TaxID=7725 RepID=UPI0019392CA3|nr:uncharacterized protein LOC120345780 [Styela clava]